MNSQPLGTITKERGKNSTALTVTTRFVENVPAQLRGWQRGCKEVTRKACFRDLPGGAVHPEASL
jgi:hypothetical protein